MKDNSKSLSTIREKLHRATVTTLSMQFLPELGIPTPALLLKTRASQGARKWRNTPFDGARKVWTQMSYKSSCTSTK